MKTIKISESVTLELSDDFKPQPITGFNEWVEALPTYKKTRGKLMIGDRYCCLAVKRDIETNGQCWITDTVRLQRFIVDRDGGDTATNKSNYFGASGLGRYGDLPPGAKIVIKHSHDLIYLSLSSFNDLPESGPDHTLTAEVIKHCFCEKWGI